MKTQPFTITVVRSMAEGYVGKVKATEEFGPYDAESAFEALRIFMQIHTRYFVQTKSAQFAVAVMPAKAVKLVEPVLICD